MRGRPRRWCVVGDGRSTPPGSWPLSYIPNDEGPLAIDGAREKLANDFRPKRAGERCRGAHAAAEVAALSSKTVSVKSSPVPTFQDDETDKVDEIRVREPDAKITHAGVKDVEAHGDFQNCRAGGNPGDRRERLATEPRGKWGLESTRVLVTVPMFILQNGRWIGDRGCAFDKTTGTRSRQHALGAFAVGGNPKVRAVCGESPVRQSLSAG